MTSSLDALRQLTVIVADTGDVEAIRKFCPQEATTNPSLCLAAAKLPAYRHLVEEAISWGKEKCPERGQEQTNWILDRLICLFGKAILDIIPGRVSTEVDATLSFDTAASVERARRIISIYEGLPN